MGLNLRSDQDPSKKEPGLESPATLETEQDRLASIYGLKNMCRPVWSLQVYLGFRATALSALLEDKPGSTNTHANLIWNFAWVAAIANHPSVGVRLESLVRRHYPGVCPYCGQNPHTCKTTRPKQRLSVVELAGFERTLLFRTNIQQMFASIYPDNELWKTAHHFQAEVGELGQAIVRGYSSFIHDQYIPPLAPKILTTEIEMELADCLAHLFGLANLLCIDLLDEVRSFFKEGCPQCKGMRCIKCDTANLELKKVDTQPAEPLSFVAEPARSAGDRKTVPEI